MAEGETLGARLIALVERSGLKGDTLARRLGYEGRSGTQRILDHSYDPEFAPPALLRRFESLIGTGQPPITEADVIQAFGSVQTQRLQTFAPKHEMAFTGSLTRDVPIYGTGLGAKLKVEVIGEETSSFLEVDQFDLRTDDTLGYMRRPSQFDQNRDLYGIYIEGASMHPRFDDGQAVLVDPKRPPMIGDDVVLHLALPDEHEGEAIGAVLVKRLLRRTADYYELEQFNPPAVFRVRRPAVKKVHRIVTYGELLS